MDFSNVLFRFLITICGFTCITALKCRSCTYFTVDRSMHGTVRNIASEVFEQFNDDTCPQHVGQELKTINLEECLEIPGKISRCSFMKGSVILTIPLTLLRDVDVQLQVYHRGCYYPSKTQHRTLGCRPRHSSNHEASYINHVVNRKMPSSEPYTVSEFIGETCVCSDMYCSRVSTNSGNSANVFFGYKTLLHIMVIQWLFEYVCRPTSHK